MTALLCLVVGWVLGAITVLVMGALLSSSKDSAYEEHRRELERRKAQEQALMEYLKIMEAQLVELWTKDDPE